MENDDVLSPILGRRQILRTAGALSLLGLGLSKVARGQGLLTALETEAGTPVSAFDASDLVDDPRMATVCTIAPSLTQGPYYLNLNLMRSDITEGLPGLPTRLHIQVVRSSDCAPIPNAVVDLWHNNAPGVYSGFANQGTQGQTFLRGVQTTDANGATYFDTIYPGWYPGRTTHTHLKVRPTGQTELTTQLYFRQRLTNRVYQTGPYIGHGPNPTTNQTDSLFRQETVVDIVQATGGQLVLAIVIAVA